MNNLLLRLQWYRKRLNSMSLLELWHRFIEQEKRAVSRIYFPKFIEKIDVNKTLPRLPYLAEELNRLAENDLLIKEWRKLAQSAVTRQFKFLGMKWPSNESGNIWHLDPITKKHWPMNIYCFHINYRNTSVYGDVKYVWEVNRLQYLQPIAALAAIENNLDLSKYCLNEIENWIDCNPPYQGINWSSGIELACRIVSILVVISLLSDTIPTPEQKIKIQNVLALHGYWLMRYPSRYSSANNHLIAEASALYLLGKLAPNLPQADQWTTYGRYTLLEEITKQIHDDGVGAEQSPSYTAFTIEWLLLCGIIGNHYSDEFPTCYWQRIEKAGEFIRWLTDKKGNQPRIGDDDESQVIYSPIPNTSYPSSILSCISNLSKQQYLTPPVYIPHLREIFFGRPNNKPKLLQGKKSFRYGGYTISRNYMNNTEYLLVIDHGPVGYLSIAAHGHADALAIWLHINGFPVLVDAGTYQYHSGGIWRDHMRGTSAHNTLSIAGKNSSIISGAFNWETKSNSKLLTFSDESDGLTLIAENDGYEQQYKVRHRRHIQQFNNGSFIVKDSLHGKADVLPIEIGFLFHPDLTIIKKDDYWLVSRKNEVMIEIESQTDYLEGKVKRGQFEPMQGWYSKAFGYVTASSRLVFEGSLGVDRESSILFKPILTN